MGILIWLMIAYGMSNILVYGSIFNGMRNNISAIASLQLPFVSGIFQFVSDLLSCMMCTSTWVGFFLSLAIYSPCHEIIELNKYVSIFFDGMLASGFVWAFNSLVEWFEENRPQK